MSWVAGADGFKARWCVVLINRVSGEMRCRIAPDFLSLTRLDERPSIVCVDIPIGLPEFTAKGGRACERLARGLLGRRASSVFSAVGRGALNAVDRVAADKLSRSAGGLGIGAQAWGLSRKLKEADAAMTPELQSLVRECHPEVSFWAMNDGKALAHGKKTLEGERERKVLLTTSGMPSAFVSQLPPGLWVGRDDFLDACAALWTACRVADGLATRLPNEPDFDARGLDQAIWF